MKKGGKGRINNRRVLFIPRCEIISIRDHKYNKKSITFVPKEIKFNV